MVRNAVIVVVFALLAACRAKPPAWHTGPAAPIEGRTRITLGAGETWTGAIQAKAGEWVVVRVDGYEPIRVTARLSNVRNERGKNQVAGQVVRDGEVRVHVRLNQQWFHGTYDVNVIVLPAQDVETWQIGSKILDAHVPIDWAPSEEPPYDVDDEEAIALRLDDGQRDPDDSSTADPTPAADTWTAARQAWRNQANAERLDILYDAEHELGPGAVEVGRFDVGAKQRFMIAVLTREDTPVRVKVLTGGGDLRDVELADRTVLAPYFIRSDAFALDHADTIEVAVSTYGDFTDAFVFVMRDP